MSNGILIGFEMESRYSGSYAWLCLECKKRGIFSYNNSSRTTCKRCGIARKVRNNK